MKMAYKIPDSVRGKAREFMKSVVKTLKESNVVESIDAAALDMLARNYSLFIKASEELESQTLTLTNRQGNAVANPLIRIVRDSQTSCMQIMTEFGLTAKSRRKLPALDRKDGDMSPLDEFVKRSKDLSPGPSPQERGEAAAGH
ncbi:MAG: phage terminase small subunit P27 family [Tannerella sp.]|jgi:P27 family predicted phage terminase small subunit|nr:phage terminase small subunit P27 family [Tannerella sp.]